MKLELANTVSPVRGRCHEHAVPSASSPGRAARSAAPTPPAALQSSGTGADADS